jgi:hypothetical protein
VTSQSANDKYNSLWAALKQRYEIKRVIAERHIIDFFALKPIYHGSSVQLRDLIDTVIKNIRVLVTIELPMNQLTELFLINKLSTENWNHQIPEEHLR